MRSGERRRDCIAPFRADLLTYRTLKRRAFLRRADDPYFFPGLSFSMAPARTQ